MSQISITVGIFVTALLGLPLAPYEDKNCDKMNCESFWIVNYWRVVWSIPAILAIIQSTLLFFVFKYDTPFTLKKKNQFRDLEELMSKIYHPECV